MLLHPLRRSSTEIVLHLPVVENSIERGDPFGGGVSPEQMNTGLRRETLEWFRRTDMNSKNIVINGDHVIM